MLKSYEDILFDQQVFFFQAEDGIRDLTVTEVQTCALPISDRSCCTHPTRPSSWSAPGRSRTDRKSTRLNSSHSQISYAVFCLKKKTSGSSPVWRSYFRYARFLPGRDRASPPLPPSI